MIVEEKLYLNKEIKLLFNWFVLMIYKYEKFKVS